MAKQQPTSTVPTATGDKVTVPDGELNTAADPKTANGDEVRKQNGISASATAEQVLADGGKDTIDHTEKSTERPDVPAAPDTAAAPAESGKTVNGRVLAAITFGEVRFEPNDVIEGVPEKLAKQHADSIDTTPEAVAYARAHGFPARAYPKD